MSDNWKDKAVSVRKGEELDLKVLKEYFNQHLPQFTGDLKVKQFPGGASNLTYAVDIGDKRMVLRRPPFGPKIKSAHDMSREYKLFSKLSVLMIKSLNHFCSAKTKASWAKNFM